MFMNIRIKELRESKNWSLGDLTFELAKLSYRYTRQTLFNWETGATEPRASNVACLAEVFSVPIEYFFDDKLH